MGRPVMTRSIKRNRLRLLDQATECAGQVAPAALQAVAHCESNAPSPSKVAAPRVRKVKPRKKATRVKR